MDLVRIQFTRRALVRGGSLYLPGETACFAPDLAQSFLDQGAATLLTSLDAPPLNKMVASPAHKKEKHG